MNAKKIDYRLWAMQALSDYQVQNGLKKGELADSIGYSYQYLRKIQTGEKAPSIQFLKKVEELTGQPIPNQPPTSQTDVHEPRAPYGNQFELLLKEYQKHMEDLRDNIKDLRASVEDLRRENLYLHDQNKNHQQ